MLLPARPSRSRAGGIVSRKLNTATVQSTPGRLTLVAPWGVFFLSFGRLLEGSEAFEGDDVGAPAVAAADHDIALVITAMGHVGSGVGSGTVVHS